MSCHSLFTLVWFYEILEFSLCPPSFWLTMCTGLFSSYMRILSFLLSRFPPLASYSVGQVRNTFLGVEGGKWHKEFATESWHH